ncbi:hypothetical protein ScPMuIL_004576 [Solemya velum]
MRTLIIQGLLCMALAVISTDAVCTSHDDCASGSCCYKRPQFLVVSRKRAQGLPIQAIDAVAKTGVCEAFKTLDTSCWPLEKANGHCGCAPVLVNWCQHNRLEAYLIQLVFLYR